MNLPRLLHRLLVLSVVAWSAVFLWLAWRASAHSYFWATSGPVFLPADMPDYIAQVQQSTDWQTPLFYALLPLAAYGLGSIVSVLMKARVT